MVGNPRYGRIGMVAMPLLVLEVVLGPPMELIGNLVIPVAYGPGLLDPTAALAFLCLTFVFGTAISIGTLALEERQLRRTPNAANSGRIALAALVENFCYRQINLVYRLRGVWRFLRNDTDWAAVPRTGFSRGTDDNTSWPLQQDRRAAEAEPEPYEPEARDKASASYEPMNGRKTG